MADVSIIRCERALRAFLEAGVHREDLVVAIRTQYVDPNRVVFEQYCRDSGLSVDEWCAKLAGAIATQPDLYRRCLTIFTDDDERALRAGMERAIAVTRSDSPAEVYTLAGLFSANAFSYGTRIGFCLEWCLPEAELRQFSVPEWVFPFLPLLRGKALLPVMAAHEYGHAVQQLNDDGTLAAKVVNEGIAVAVSEQAVPGADLADYLVFSEPETSWCRSHAPDLHRAFLERADSTDRVVKDGFCSAPATPVMPGAPLRVGYYIGLAICRDYMAGGRSAADLVRETSAKHILEAAHWI